MDLGKKVPQKEGPLIFTEPLSVLSHLLILPATQKREHSDPPIPPHLAPRRDRAQRGEVFSPRSQRSYKAKGSFFVQQVQTFPF